MPNLIDQAILDGIRNGTIRPRGGHTSDTTWGINWRDGKFYKFSYGEDYQEIEEEIDESKLLWALSASGLKKKIIAEHHLEQLTSHYLNLVPTVERAKSIETLENHAWEHPTHDTHVVRECHRLRKVPLQDLHVEDLRLLVGQNIGLKWLVPLALERLEKDPLLEGDYYPGDLLHSILQIESSYWQQFPQMLNAAKKLTQQAIQQLGRFGTESALETSRLIEATYYKLPNLS